MGACLKCKATGEVLGPDNTIVLCPHCKGQGHTLNGELVFREVGPDKFEFGPRFKAERRVYFFTAAEVEKYRNSSDHGKMTMIARKKAAGQWRLV